MKRKEILLSSFFFIFQHLAVNYEILALLVQQFCFIQPIQPASVCRDADGTASNCNADCLEFYARDSFYDTWVELCRWGIYFYLGTRSHCSLT
jgi:hypothetical protein